MKLLTTAFILAASLTAHTFSAAQIAPAPTDEKITFHADESYPESFDWSYRQKAFFVGSLRKGEIGKVTMDGTYTPFASDPLMFGSGGIKYDKKRNIVWAALCDIGVATKSTPATQGKVGAIIGFDATTGKRKHFVDLAKLDNGAHCANDLAFDPAGNIYVTDSFSPAVYVIDRNMRARELVHSEKFTGKDFNLNGIVYHPGGFLLIGKHNSGEVFRISLKPKVEVQAVQLNSAIPGADGFALVDRDTIVVAQNAGNDRAVSLKSKDGWKSAEVVELAKSGATFPTAVTVAGSKVYMLSNRVDTLFDPKAQKVSDYLLQRLPAAPQAAK